MKRQTIVRRANESEYERMKAQSLDKYQTSAGERFYSLSMRSHYGVPAMDPSRDVVDGGLISFEIPSRIIDCQNLLGKAAREIGMLNYNIVQRMVVEDLEAQQIAFDLGDDSARGADRIRAQLRMALMGLAIHWNIYRPEHRRSSYFARDFVPQMFDDEDKQDN